MVLLRKIDSTNTYIKENVNQFKNFDSVYTPNQTSGKGRTGHVWVSEPYKNVAMSMYIDDDKLLKKYNLISVVVGVLVAEYLTNLGINNVSIKWPNDVYVNDKKICGILLEGSLPKYMIIGIGINVNQEFFGEFPATSIKNELGFEIEPSLVAADINETLIDILKNLDEQENTYLERYHDFDYLLNKTISFMSNGDQLKGIAKGIDFDGSLKVLCNNTLINVNANEVNLVRKV